MRKALKSVWTSVCVATAALIALPAYADTYTGILDEFIPEENLLILDGEVEFFVPDTIPLPDLEIGEEITVEFEEMDGSKIIELVILPE
ncbi:MAG TPA: hypothetical protein DCS30_10880 [Rhizobiales bacterium]|nr:hypothetical protein [Hyphomicrobiales bacterium]